MSRLATLSTNLMLTIYDLFELSLPFLYLFLSSDWLSWVR